MHKKVLACSVIVVLLCVIGCSIDSEPNPPIGITFRESLLYENYVARLHNTSSNQIMVQLHIESADGKKERDWKFPIKPNDTIEIGVIEVDWHFDPGEKGWVSVDGFKKKLKFRIRDNCQWDEKVE